MAAAPPRPPDPAASDRRAWLVAAGVVLAGCLAYANSLDGAWVFDDLPAIRDNPTLRPPYSPATVLSPPVGSGVGGRPLANLTFALNHALGGMEVHGYHAFNLVLHLGSALLLFGLVRRTLRPAATGPAAAAALLWVVHPVTSAAVSYVSQRTELLMAFFYLLTLYGAARDHEAPHRRWRGVAVGACALGMLSKEVMVTAPVMVWLYDRVFRSGSFRAAWRARRSFYLALAAAWLPLGLVLTTGLSQRSVGFGLGVSPLDYALTETQALLLYLKLAVWPHPLVFDYGPIYATGALRTLAGAALVLTLIALSVGAVRRGSAFGFAGAAFFLLLAPTSSLVPVAEQPIAENRLYLPLAVLVATLVSAAGSRLAGRRRGALVLAAAGALGGLTLARNADYRTEAALWTDTVRKRPENHRAAYNLGIVRLEAGQPAAALPQFQAALRLRPTEPKAHNSLGNALLELDRPAEAAAAFAEAVRLNPAHAAAWGNLGTARLRLGDAAGALPCLETALRLDPALADARYNAGSACLELGRLDEAITHFTAAAALKPADAEIRNYLGAAQLRAGHAAEAIAQFEHALRLQPDYADARANLALARAAGAAARPR